MVGNQYLILITFYRTKSKFYVGFFISSIISNSNVQIFALLQYTSIGNNCEFEKRRGGRGVCVEVGGGEGCVCGGGGGEGWGMEHVIK